MKRLLGLVLAAAVALLVAAASGVFSPPTAVQGQVISLGRVESDTGTYPTARLRLADREVSVQLPRLQGCAPGRSIRLLRSRLPWGDVFRPQAAPCPA